MSQALICQLVCSNPQSVQFLIHGWGPLQLCLPEIQTPVIHHPLTSTKVMLLYPMMSRQFISCLQSHHC